MNTSKSDPRCALVEEAIRDLERKAIPASITTGNRFIDRNLYGLEGYGVHFLCGHRKVGKTSFILNKVNKVLKRNGSVLYLTSRESAEEIRRKLVIISAGVESGSKVGYSPEEKKRLQEAEAFINNAHFTIETIKGDSIESVFDKCTVKQPAPNLIIIDGNEDIVSTGKSDVERVNKYIGLTAWICKCHIFVLSDIEASGIKNKRTINMILRDANPRKIINRISRDKKIEAGETMLLYRKDYFRVPKEHDSIASILISSCASKSTIVKCDYRYDLSTLSFNRIKEAPAH